MSGYPVKMTVSVLFSDGSTHEYEVDARSDADVRRRAEETAAAFASAGRINDARRMLSVAGPETLVGKVIAGLGDHPLAGFDPPDGYYFLRPYRPPVQLGLAGPKTCHRTAGGVMVHVKPGCRCPRPRW